MAARTYVTDIMVMNEEYGLDVEVTVKRYLPMWIPDKMADVNDLPADIRQSLLAWLMGAEKSAVTP